MGMDIRVPPVAVTSAEPTQDDTHRADSSRVALVAVIALLLVPLVFLLVRLAFGNYISTSDIALIESRVRDVGTRSTPLVGPYSRYGWNHPGPFLFYALTIPYRLLGSSARGLLAGGVLLNGISIAAIAWLLWRRGRVAGLLLGGLVLAILLRALGGGFLMFPWNPYLIVLPMFVLALLAWNIACGEHWLLPFAIGVASFLVQTHVGSSLPTLALVFIALVALVVDALGHRVAHLRRVLIASALVALFMWWPPVLQQLQPSGGNLGDLWNYWTGSHSNTPGLVDGARIVAPQLSLPAPWITGHERIGVFTAALDPHWAVPFVLLLLVGAFVVAWRRRDREALTLDIIALTFVLVAWIASASVVDTPFSYILRWTWLVGALAWLAIGWTLLRAISWPRPVAVGAGVVIVALVIGTCVSAVRAKTPEPQIEQAARAVMPAVRAVARQSPQPVIVRGAGGIGSGALADAVYIQLERDGLDPKFDKDLAYIVGDRHAIDDAQARTVIIAAADEFIDPIASDPRYKLIASHDSLSPDDRAYLTNTIAAINALPPLDRIGWPDKHPAEWARIKSINAQHPLREAVFVGPPTAP
jgi:hypothetical protein